MAPLEQFVLLGDSITAMTNDTSGGFAPASELQNAYVRRLDVINRGFGGYNTDHILSILDEILPKPEQARIRFMTIWFGANDANKSKGFIDQYVPLDRFQQNLKSIINHPSVTAHTPNIILFTPPPVEESLLSELVKKMKENGMDMPLPADRAQDAKLYADAVNEVAAEEGVALVDVWGACMEKAGWKEGDTLPGTTENGRSEELAGLLSDGLHLGSDGYKVVFEELLRVIKKKWPEYPPYKMPYAVKVPWEVAFGDQLGDVREY